MREERGGEVILGVLQSAKHSSSKASLNSIVMPMM